MSLKNSHKDSHYINHQSQTLINNIREVVFGVQDGMVSTLGAITGIAVGSSSIPTVILAGLAIISVESVSMAIGSYISSHSEGKLSERAIAEETEEINTCIDCETEEAEELFIRDGWPPKLAKEMAQTTKKDKSLMLKEMTYRELGINPYKKDGSIRNGIVMFFAYIVGGLIPLSPYFFLPISGALSVSISATLVGLFMLGIIVARYTAQNWIRSGARLLVFGGIALLVGYIVGILAGI